MCPGDRLLADYPKNAGKGVFEAGSRVFVKDVFTRHKESLHLGVAFLDELDDGIRTHARQQLDEAAERNIVSYGQVMDERQRENEVRSPRAAAEK